MRSAVTGDSNPFEESLSVHVGDVDPLLNWAERASDVTSVVVAPVELHRRNLKLRLTDANRPLDAFGFAGPATVVASVLETGGKASKVLDRVDRLALLGEILSEEGEAAERFRWVLGGDPSRSGNAIDQARREVEVLTNFHPVRVRAFRSAAAALPAPIDRDAEDLLDGTIAVERALRCRSDRVPSDGAIIRRATRAIRDTDGAAWREAYPTVDRVALAGVSTIPATLVDLFGVLASRCDVECHVFLRRGTGPVLADRVTDVGTVAYPGRVVVT